MEYIKPNPYPVKGSCNRIGYGYRFKKRSKYGKVEKRKAYRECRKFGFDLSETWDLDVTIMGWLSDNIGNYFRECGDPSSWDDVDLEGNPISKDNMQDCFKAGIERRKEFLEQLEKFLVNCEPNKFYKFTQFVIPRLTILRHNSHGYPYGVKSLQEWKDILNNMINSFLLGGHDKNFIKYFFSLWD